MSSTRKVRLPFDCQMRLAQEFVALLGRRWVNRRAVELTPPEVPSDAVDMVELESEEADLARSVNRPASKTW
ncbi:hypothetical protein AAHC03_016674 [Spirometra sp. Aus1]